MTLQLKRTPGLYLVGFMASGKTTVGRAVAAQLGWEFVDIDSEVEAQEGQSIARIFRERGEQAFRELEANVVRRYVTEIERGLPHVLALGGGAAVQPRNWDLIACNGVTVWLDCPLTIVQRRLGDDRTRPLAADRSRLEQLFEDRRPLYARAHYRVEVDCDDVPTIVTRVVSLPIF